ncbi:MAG TPA: two-component sensor histidine kinase, partial [Geomonas sp.]|nr:two-component sensor histidine kinase [Geomonas sp.]
MKIKIKYKLFLAMLAATGAVVICMFLIVQWSLGRGFLSYINTIEKERFAKLAEVLEETYTARGSWEFLDKDQDAWPRLMAMTLPHEGSGSEQERMERRVRRERMARKLPAPSGDFSNISSNRLPSWFKHRFETRVFLLDAAKNQIAGPPGLPKSQVDFKKITFNHQVVGYLGIRPRQRLTDKHQLLFVKQQNV